MADPKEVQRCFNQAAHNERFVQKLLDDMLPNQPEFADWAVIAMFYAALHYTKGALLRDRDVSAYTHRSHRDHLDEVHLGHNDLVRENFEEEVSIAYKELFDRAQEARYRPFYARLQGQHALNFVNLLRVHLDSIKRACE